MAKAIKGLHKKGGRSPEKSGNIEIWEGWGDGKEKSGMEVRMGEEKQVVKLKAKMVGKKGKESKAEEDR